MDLDLKQRQHVTALPPMDIVHKETNTCLQKLSSFTQSNFISTKNFCDRPIGKLRANVMVENEFHYNEWGVSILAKEVKKSFFSKANIGNCRRIEVISSLANTTSIASPQFQP